jgi:hypothetical protein
MIHDEAIAVKRKPRRASAQPFFFLLSQTTPFLRRIFAVVCFLLLMTASSYAQDDDEDDDELPDVRPGVVAKYVGADGSAHVRRDEAIQFVWGEQSPDPRLPQGKFEVQWSGRLFTIEPGE